MPPLSLEPPVYEIGELKFSPTSGVLEILDEKIVLRAREANLFTALIESFPEVLSRSAIESQLWKDSYATNATINQTVKSLRFSLKDEERTIIRTIPKQGYVLSKKPNVILETETAAIGSTLIPPTTTQVTAQRHSTLIRNCLIAIAVVTSAFVLGLSGIVDRDTSRVSQKIEGSWYFMDAIPAELKEKINQNYSDSYVMHSGEKYRVCQFSGEVMQCQNIEL